MIPLSLVLLGLFLVVLLLPSPTEPFWLEPAIIGLGVAWLADLGLFRQASARLKRAGMPAKS